ncbi:beta-galactosidase [Calditrichota bacterium]
MKILFQLFILLSIVLLFSCQIEKEDFADLSKSNYDFSQPDFIPVSTWYSGGKARAPMLSEITENSEEEWEKDLQQIKSLGFNTVRTWVEWAHCETSPGKYNFENLKLLADLAQKIGLKLIIQLYVDSAPDWVGKEFPDGLYEAQNGAKVKSQAAPGFCTDHPGVRKSVLNFITETAKIASQYPNFHGWDLWSEPHIVNWAYINYVPNVQFCFCDFTKSRFREWLKIKYGTLEKLNKAWYRNFETWDEVDPPRFGTILSYTDFIDWKNFIYQKLAGDLGMRYGAVRRGDTAHVITSHAAVPSIFYSPYNGYGATDDFLMSEQVDYYGTSLYPKHNHPSRHWEPWKFMVAVDFSRSANKKNKGFYVGELQAGKGTIGLNIGDPITPGDHRIWMWSATAKGAKAINVYAYYPMSSGYESGGYGLINLDGSVTHRAIEAGKTAKIISKHKELLLDSKPVKSEIGLLYNPLAQMVGGEQRHSTWDMHQLSLFGYYRVFAENNIPVDFIHRQDLETENLSQYKLLIVPYPLMFTQQAADKIKSFVNNGGYVVAEARLAWNDERGFATDIIPGMGLDKVFGVRELKIKMDETVTMKMVPSSSLLTSNIKNVLKGARFAESFEVYIDGNTQVIARLEDGSPCMVSNRIGKGETLIIGSFLGMANHQEPNKNNTQFLLNLIDWAEIERPFTTSHDGKTDTPVEVRMSKNSEGLILFVINHGTSHEKVKISLRAKDDGQYSLKELISEKEKRIKSQNKKLNLTLDISNRDVQVWDINKSN